MKKILITLLLILLLLVIVQPIKAATTLIQLKVSVSNIIAGENSDYTFQLIPLKDPIVTNQWITIITPKDIQLPAEIALEDVYINENEHPVSCKVVQSQSIQILIPPLTEGFLNIAFQGSDQFTNPFHCEPVDFTLVWDERAIMAISAPIHFNAPASSIEYKFSESQKVPYWYDKPVSLALTSSSAKEIFYSVNSGDEQIYTTPIDFEQGWYELTVTGVRASGVREKSIELTIQVDMQSPEITLISPKDNFITNQMVTPFIFSVLDLSKVQLIVQDRVYYVEGAKSPFEISIPVTLQDGTNHILWKATDEVGLITSGSLVVNLDRTPPALTVYSPRKGDVICGNQVEITGKSEPGSRLYLGEKDIPLDVFGNFSMFLVPAKGQNTLELRCYDPAGNETLVQIDYYYFAGKLVEIWIDKINASVEGKDVSISPPPLIEPVSGEIYLPLRFLPAVIDYQLEWNTQDGVAILKRDEVHILVKPNDSKIRIKSNGKSENIVMDYPPLLINNVIMIPSEFLKKILGAELLFDVDEKKLLINFCDRSE
jgi:hypothetical protein